MNSKHSNNLQLQNEFIKLYRNRLTDIIRTTKKEYYKDDIEKTEIEPKVCDTA